MDLLTCAAPFRPLRVRPDCALAAGVLLRPRREFVFAEWIERLRAAGDGTSRGYHIAPRGCAMKSKAKFPIDIKSFY